MEDLLVKSLHGFTSPRRTKSVLYPLWSSPTNIYIDTDFKLNVNIHLFVHHRRGKEIPAKLRGGKKATANRTQVRPE